VEVVFGADVGLLGIAIVIAFVDFLVLPWRAGAGLYSRKA